MNILFLEKLICAGHDVSDGGLITTILEMAIAGNCSVDVKFPPDFPNSSCPFKVLFAEEAGIVLEIRQGDWERVQSEYAKAAVPCWAIGKSDTQIRGPGAKVLNYFKIVQCRFWEFFYFIFRFR